jgi:hypothetical protein
MVFASRGGRTFHSSRLCPSLWNGLENAAVARGNAAGEIFLIPLKEAAFDWRLTLCQSCFPDPEITSDFGVLADPPEMPRAMRQRDLEELCALGITEREAFAWWDMGFVPRQVQDLLEAGVPLFMAELAWNAGDTQNEIHERYVRRR